MKAFATWYQSMYFKPNVRPDLLCLTPYISFLWHLKFLCIFTAPTHPSEHTIFIFFNQHTLINPLKALNDLVPSFFLSVWWSHLYASLPSSTLFYSAELIFENFIGEINLSALNLHTYLNTFYRL